MGYDDRGQSLLIRDFENEYRISMPLLGDHQQENAATAIAALGVSSDGRVGTSRTPTCWTGSLTCAGRVGWRS